MNEVRTLGEPRIWPRVKWTRASQLAALLDDMVNLDGCRDLAPAQAFGALRQLDKVQATRFLAQCLPRMEALRWVAACLATMPPPELPARIVARKALTRWLADPTDVNRRIAYDAGEISGWATAEGAGCLSVFLSGGSIVPATVEGMVPPSAGSFGKAVAGAVMMSAYADGPHAFEGRIAAHIDLGEKTAAGEALNG